MCYGHTVFVFFTRTYIGPPWGVSQRRPPLFPLVSRRRALPCVFGLAMKSPPMSIDHCAIVASMGLGH